MIYTLRFFCSKCSLFHNSNMYCFCINHILYTECVKIRKNNSGAKRLKKSKSRNTIFEPCDELSWIFLRTRRSAIVILITNFWRWQRQYRHTAELSAMFLLPALSWPSSQIILRLNKKTLYYFETCGNGVTSDAAVNSRNGVLSHAPVIISNLLLRVYFLWLLCFII